MKVCAITIILSTIFTIAPTNLITDKEMDILAALEDGIPWPVEKPMPLALHSTPVLGTEFHACLGHGFFCESNVEQGRIPTTGSSMNICIAINDVLNKQNAFKNLDISIESLLMHASSCETCTNRLDKLDPEILESLFSQDLSPIEEYQHEDPEDSEQSRAVHEVLIPSLGTNAQTTAKAVVEKHGAYAIYAACEAVSSLIRRHQRLKNKNDESIYLLLDGSIKIGTEIIISKQSVASEIANIADIWDPTSVREPSDEAYLLASWMFEAARDLPTLLCHYKAHPHSGDRLSLITVKTDVRVDNASKRWNLRTVT